ncbi:MAG TPA: hypothetical protein VKA26_04405 [Ignavibacteriaceae bacterium]|nr:hypothetical protein [Ignavibacteriaceae bacterium]
MKKKTEKNKELLSAYLDGELSENEIKDLEQRISESEELSAELNELKKIKSLTSSSSENLAEANYFESGLMQKIHSGKSATAKFKKWSPVIGFSTLAIILMIVLKLNPGILDQFVENQKTTLAGFYKENLQPLLYAADLTNEDIFNFAMYKQLPLDKSTNKYIQLGTSDNGKEFVEFRTIDNAPSENNLQKFVTALDLNEKQKEQVDSIINSYSEELQSQILINGNNTVAINKNLWNYNKALIADLYAYAEKNNQKVFAKIIPAGYKSVDPVTVTRAISEVKSNNNNDYIFVTPDTIFSEKYKFDKKDFAKQMVDLKKSMEEMKKEWKKSNFVIKTDSNFYKVFGDSNKANNYRIMIDSNICRVNIPKIAISPDLPNFDSIFSEMHLEKITENLKNFTVEMPKGFPFKGGDFKFKYGNGDSVKSFKFDMPPIKIDSILHESFKVLDSMNIPIPKEVYKALDSLNFDNFNFDDSGKSFDKKEFKKQMEEARKELLKLKKKNKELKKRPEKAPKPVTADTVKS